MTDQLSFFARMISCGAYELRLALPMTASYARIIREVTEAGIEQKFCQRVFHANSLDEGVSVLSLRLGLETLPWDTLKDLAQVLSDGERKWSFPKARNRDIIGAIVRNCPKDEVDEAVYRLIEDNRLEPVQQYQEWVVGPLGITESVPKRGAASSDSLVSFLVSHVDVSICHWMKRSDPECSIPGASAFLIGWFVVGFSDAAI